MVILLITGSICSGKKYLANYLKDKYEYVLHPLNEVNRLEKSISDENNSKVDDELNKVLNVALLDFRRSHVIYPVIYTKSVDKLLFKRSYIKIVSITAPLLIRYQKFCEKIEHESINLDNNQSTPVKYNRKLTYDLNDKEKKNKVKDKIDDIDKKNKVLDNVDLSDIVETQEVSRVIIDYTESTKSPTKDNKGYTSNNGNDNITNVNKMTLNGDKDKDSITILEKNHSTSTPTKSNEFIHNKGITNVIQGKSKVISLHNFVELDDYLNFESGLVELMVKSNIKIINKFTETCIANEVLKYAFIKDKLFRPNWDQYFLKLAYIVKERSNCMKRSVGVVIMKENRIISTGYNGVPGKINCYEGGCERCNSNISQGLKLDECRCIHAEESAILEIGVHVAKDGTLYSTLSPCKWCVKVIIAAKIKRVVFHEEFTNNEDARISLTNEGIKYEKIDII